MKKLIFVICTFIFLNLRPSDSKKIPTVLSGSRLASISRGKYINLKNLKKCLAQGFNSSDGRVVKAYASGAVDCGLLPSRVKPMTLKLAFAVASLIDAWHYGDSVENKPPTLHVVSLRRPLGEILSFWCGGQTAGNF